MYKFLLCLRYLRTRYIALACIVSVMLGVATMIVVNSVMAGFGTEMRERIHGILADVIIETNNLDGAPDPERLKKIAEQAAGDEIEAMTGTVEVYGMLSFQYAGQYITRPVTIIGTNPEEKAKVGPLVDYLASYNVLRENDQVIRQPLRSRDVPPGWSLTEEAAAYRHRWVSRQQWALNGFQGHNPPSRQQQRTAENTSPEFAPATDGADVFPSPGPGADNATTPDSTPVGTPGSGGDASGDSGFPATFDEPAAGGDRVDAADLPAVGNPPQNIESTPEFEDEFPKQPGLPEQFFEDMPEVFAREGAPEDLFPQETETIDPAEPLPARLYAGIGLISFPVKDAETGTTRTMMMVQPGDDVKISTVTSGRPPQAVHFNATIVDVFKSGMSEYDSNLVFCNLEELQKARGMIDPQSGVKSITSIQIKLKDFAKSDEVVRRLRAAFPPGMFSVRTWEQKQGPLLAAVEIESAILNVLLFLIIAVAGFGILAIFFMIVVEKTRDIGILKALGASSRGVMSIFLSYGLGLGIVGSGVGVTLGLLFVHYINQIEAVITKLTGRKVFDEAIYYFPEIPTDVQPLMVLWVAMGAIAIAVLASILPARRAARLHPVEALRYE